MRTILHFVSWSVGLAEPQTQTSRAERQCLSKWAVGKTHLIEIGSWHGVTTSELRQVMAPEGVLFAVDPFPRGRLGFSTQRVIARREVSSIRNGRVEWIRSTGKEAAARHLAEGRPSVDFVFVDGDHTYEAIRDDWNGWSGLVSSGGIMAFHDSRSSVDREIEGAGSAIFTREVILLDERFALVDSADTLTVIRRKIGDHDEVYKNRGLDGAFHVKV
jgi:hypothetical protein